MASDNIRTRLTPYDFDATFYQNYNRTRYNENNNRIIIPSYYQTTPQDNLNNASYYNSKFYKYNDIDNKNNWRNNTPIFGYNDGRNLSIQETLKPPQQLPMIITNTSVITGSY